MTIPTTGIDETTPVGSEAKSNGDNRIREYKTQVREILEVDHNFQSSGQDADAGKHKKVSLIEIVDLGTGASGEPILGAQTVSGKPELVYTDEDDNDVQITNSGAIHLNSARQTNNVYIKAINNAGTGTVDLIKANASDVAVLPDASELATSAAPTSDADIANKKYVDDTVIASKLVQMVSTSNGAVSSGTTTIPYDDTIPQNTEGDEYITLAITPNNTSNKLTIEFTGNFGASIDGQPFSVALFQDSTTGALAATMMSPRYQTTIGMTQITLKWVMTAGTVSSTTFKIRAGMKTSGTLYFNGDSSGSRRFGGVSASTLTITETVV